MAVKDDVARWRPVAEALDPSKVPRTFSYPLDVILGESADVAGFFNDHWRTIRNTDGSVAQPGLELAACAAKPELHEKCGEDIESLASAASQVNWQFRRSTRAAAGAPYDAGLTELREMRATYVWYFDDGVEEAEDQELSNLIDAHETEPPTNDALAHALDDHAAFGEGVAHRLQEMQGFDVTMMVRARQTAKKLRERPSAPVVLSAASRALLDLRNRLFLLLLTRMNLVRGAARYVYRSDPDRIRKVTSAFERRRRQANREREDETNTPGAPSDPATPATPTPVTPAPQS